MEGQKEYLLADGLGIATSTLSTWKTKHRYPGADVAVKIAQALNTSVEFLVAGEPGTAYLKSLPELQSSSFQPPGRVKDIVDALNVMDDHELDCVKRMLFGGLLGEADKKRKTGG